MKILYTTESVISCSAFDLEESGYPDTFSSDIMPECVTERQAYWELSVSDWVDCCLDSHLFNEPAIEHFSSSFSIPANDFYFKAGFILNIFVVPFIGAIHIRDVRYPDLQNIINQLSYSGMNDSDVEKVKATLFFLFQTAVDNALISRNPALNICPFLSA